MPLPIKKLADCQTNHEKWTYYAEVYAWRIVRGYGSPDDKTCPVDPHGEWYNPFLIDQAVSRFRRIIANERRQHTEHESRDEEVQRQNEKYARGLAWRQGRLDAYDAIHHPEKLAERQRQAQKPVPDPIGDVHAELGVSAQEAPALPLDPTVDGRKSFAEALAPVVERATPASDGREPDPVDLARAAEAAE